METELCEILWAWTENYQVYVYYRNHFEMDVAQKLACFAECKARKCANKQYTLSNLSGWAKGKFNLVVLAHRSTILRVLRNNGVEKKRERRPNQLNSKNH